MSTDSVKKSPSKKLCRLLLYGIILAALSLSTVAWAGEWPRQIHIYRGSTPKLDGVISAGEYDDAVTLTGVKDWTTQFNPVTDDKDYSVRLWAKHDGQNFYFAFSVTDDVLYGIDTDMWLPEENQHAHELTRRGFPWFGDGVELLINAAYKWSKEDGQNNAGNGSSWQMVCNLTKSRLGGVGVGGLLEGEERANEKSWNTYARWIKDGAMKAVAKPKTAGKGYVIEWMIKADPCFEVKPGIFWNPDMGVTKMGFNIGTQDLDEKHKGKGNFGNINHEDWWAGERDKRTWLKQWGTLVVYPGEKPTQVYVAPNGSDNNPGTVEEPFATLTQAREVVRKINASMTSDIVVFVRGGVYRLNQTLAFDHRDSGRNGYNVIYKAYPNETPVISGSKTITGWKADANRRWKAKTGEHFRQLYINGRRAVRARGDCMPGLKLYGEDGYRTRHVEVANWGNPGEMEFCYYVVWTHTRCKVDSIIRDGDYAVFRMVQPQFMLARRKEGVTIKVPNYVENAFELLDEPGEWYLNRATKTLYYIPMPGEDMQKAEVIAPVLEKLVELRGTIERPVHNIHFSGITFAHATWLLPSRLGHVDVQANFIQVMENRLERDFYKTPVITTVHNEHIKSPSNIVCRASKSIRFEDCTFTKLGSGGIDFEFGSQDNIIVGCKFSDISGTAIQIGDVLRDDHHPEDKRTIVKNNRVVNNLIENCAVEYKGGVGIFAGYTDSTYIAHNEIRNLPYSGISLGWGWGEEDAGGGFEHYYQPYYYKTATACKNNRVEYNHIHHVLTELQDGGGVYTLGNMAGTVIRGNHIHDNPGSPGGIYLDEGSGFIEITGNSVYNVDKPMNFNNHNQNRIVTCNVHENLFGIQPNEPKQSSGKLEEVIEKAGLEPPWRHLRKPKSMCPNLNQGYQIHPIAEGTCHIYEQAQQHGHNFNPIR